MKVVIAKRDIIYQVLKVAFSATGVRPAVAELGVLDGANAAAMYDVLSPVQMFLIDSWAASAFGEYATNNAHRSWVDPLEKFAGYFGGPLDSQATFDSLYERAISRFNGKGNVQVLRANSRDAVSALREKLGPSGKLNLIYVDASHQYETVFDDLMGYQEFLAPDGFFQLNDCCHSAQGMRQNLGVLEAAVKYCKFAGFVPVLVTNTDWSDVLLVRNGSPMIDLIDRIVVGSDIDFVELPPQLFGALSVRSGRRKNLSFYRS